MKTNARGSFCNIVFICARLGEDIQCDSRTGELQVDESCFEIFSILQCQRKQKMPGSSTAEGPRVIL